MIPTSSLDPGAIITNDQRIFSIQKFIQTNPFYELQDLYQWLYFGEFGSVMEKTDKPSAKTKPELIKILEQLKIEKEMQSDDVVWESMGLSFRFVMVYLTPYHTLQCPLTRIINLLDRSPAFRGTRVHFKLDWVFVKEYIIKHSNLKQNQRVLEYSPENFSLNFSQNLIPEKMFCILDLKIL